MLSAWLPLILNSALLNLQGIIRGVFAAGREASANGTKVGSDRLVAFRLFPQTPPTEQQTQVIVRKKSLADLEPWI